MEVSLMSMLSWCWHLGSDTFLRACFHCVISSNRLFPLSHVQSCSENFSKKIAHFFGTFAPCISMALISHRAILPSENHDQHPWWSLHCFLEHLIRTLQHRLVLRKQCSLPQEFYESQNILLDFCWRQTVLLPLRQALFWDQTVTRLGLRRIKR